MSDTVIVAIVSGSAAFLTAIGGFVINVYWMGRIFDGLRLELAGLRQDLKDLTGAVNELDKRVTRIEIKLGIQP